VAGGGGRSPFQIALRASQRRALKALTRRGTAEHRQVTRARIVLLAAAGWTNAGIARKLGLVPNTVSKWRKRFFQEGLDGLGDRKRPGRPRAFPAAVVAACKAIACELPTTRGVPLGRWSLVGRNHRSCRQRGGLPSPSSRHQPRPQGRGGGWRPHGTPTPTWRP
jgi:transposase